MSLAPTNCAWDWLQILSEFLVKRDFSLLRVTPDESAIAAEYACVALQSSAFREEHVHILKQRRSMGLSVPSGFVSLSASQDVLPLLSMLDGFVADGDINAGET